MTTTGTAAAPSPSDGERDDRGQGGADHRDGHRLPRPRRMREKSSVSGGQALAAQPNIVDRPLASRDRSLASRDRSTLVSRQLTA